MTGISRRSAGLGMAAIAISSLYDGARAQVESITLPFGNGERLLVRYPQKRPLIQLNASARGTKRRRPRRRIYVSFSGSSGSAWTDGLGCLRRE